MKVDRFGKQMAVALGFIFYTLFAMGAGVISAEIRLSAIVETSQWVAMMVCAAIVMMCGGLAFLTEEEK